MAPVLIDSRDMLKLVFISALAVALVFASGFFIGHQRAAVFYQAGSEVRSLALPERVVHAEGVFETQLPGEIVAGEEIDVDQPETSVSEVVVKANPQAADKPPVNKGETSLQKTPEKKLARVKVEKKITVEQEKEIFSAENKETGLKSRREVTARQDADTTKALIVTAFTSDELSKIKYSIQVGVYGRLRNAENMVKKLQAKKFDAYITDYTNKKNETRYNVRYGYFSDKRSAISSLEKFRSDKKADGYLVKFSADNIVNIAQASVINQPVSVPQKNEAPGKEIEPAETPAEITQDKISQADVLNDSLIKTN